MKTIHLALIFSLLLAASGCSKANGSDPGTWARAYASLKTRFTNGRSELTRSLEAKKNVKTFRMKVELRLHPGSAMETEIQVACPDRERMTTRLGGTAYETVRIGTQAFIQQKDGQWTKQDIPADAYPCGANAGLPSPWAMMNEGRDMSAVIALMAGNAKAPISVTPGALVKVDGTECQQWIVSFQHPGNKSANSPGMTYTLCLGAADRLPRQLVMGSGGMVISYSDWDQPVSIDLPAQAKLDSAAAKAN